MSAPKSSPKRMTSARMSGDIFSGDDMIHFLEEVDETFELLTWSARLPYRLSVTISRTPARQKGGDP